MKKTVSILSAIAFTGIAALVACNQTPAAKPVTAAISKDSLIKRGEYLVSAVGCDDCHSPKKIGPNGMEIIPERRFSGFPQNGTVPPVNMAEVQKGWVLFAGDLTSAVGPWGQSFAANISSDETGIGNWSEEQFMKAIREGKYKGMDGTRPLLPPMPWFVYRNFSDEDIKAIYAFLQSTTPVDNVVPAPKTPEELKK
jgi:hypothetical protein